LDVGTARREEGLRECEGKGTERGLGEWESWKGKGLKNLRLPRDPLTFARRSVIETKGEIGDRCGTKLVIGEEKD